MKKAEIYISVDIEADGPIPGPNSMLSMGAAAFKADGTLIDTFESNLKLLKGAVPDPKTKAEFWDLNPEAYEVTRTNLERPEDSMPRFVSWVQSLNGKPVFVGYPASYDFMFVYWYMMKFRGMSPFSHSALDIKTMAMTMLKKPFRMSTKRNMPKEWFSKSKHTHVALDDAIEQGELFINMLNELHSTE